MDRLDSRQERPQPQRKELQGPRPARLSVRKDSNKFKKPPPGPSGRPPRVPPSAEDHRQRAPVIIYAVSPRVIQVTTDDFMSVVQRLTGPSPGPSPRTPAGKFDSGEGMTDLGISPEVEIEMETMLDRKDGSPHGILSPLPSSLPPISPNFFPFPSSLPPISPNFFPHPSSILPISPNFFMPSPDSGFGQFLSDLSPTIFGGNGQDWMSGSPLGRPSSAPLILSPGMPVDLFLD